MNLSPHQRKVAHLVAQGWNNQEIADELACSYKNVSNQIGRIYDATAIGGNGISQRVKFVLAYQQYQREQEELDVKPN